MLALDATGRFGQAGDLVDHLHTGTAGQASEVLWRTLAIALAELVSIESLTKIANCRCGTTL